MRYLLLAIGTGIGLFAVYTGFQALMDAKWQEGRLSGINARLESDNAALIQQAQTMVDAFSQTQTALNDLRKTPDPSHMPASVKSTINSLCDSRASYGVPCPPSKPDRPGDE